MFAIIRKTFICFASLLLSTPTTLFAAPPPLQFESPEHTAIGDVINLKFTDANNGQAGIPLHLPNGLVLTYGQILSFGDYYGVPEKPISFGDTEADREGRFYVIYNSFAMQPDVINEATQIIDTIKQEEKDVAAKMATGMTEEAAYDAISEDYHRRYNCITGGGCMEGSWWLDEGRYLQLSRTDYDHFGHDAWVAYTAGHQVALRTAVLAHKKQDPKILEQAYALNALACHFLSDLFAPGHLRTPRKLLDDSVKPEVVGSLLAHYMHNEENKYGLHVHNYKGDKWFMYGDRNYYHSQNAENREHLYKILQISADEIFQTYTTGVTRNDILTFNLLPMADEIDNHSHQDISPMFYWDKDQQILLRRENLSDVYSRAWISNWWGWSTLAELGRERGIPRVPKEVAMTIQHYQKN